jgi:23S rRNA (adenine2503-C2)-methyltransferase
MFYFQSFTRAKLEELLISQGSPPQKASYQAKQLFIWVYQRLETRWECMTDLSKQLRGWLEKNVSLVRLTEQSCQQASDGTRKFLWTLEDGKTVESVILAAPSSQGTRLTACISSQVGCAMGCKFCLTGVQGLDRHLQVHEIVAQVHELRRKTPITNIVFMGMGEPLQNLENTIQACDIFLDQNGMRFSKRKITVSTSGIVPAIASLGKHTAVSLAISLNATTDEQRSQIMPINRKWNIAKLLEACRNYPLGSHRRITFEYVLLKDFNDSLEDAQRLIALTRGIPHKINLIAFNPHPGSDFQRPSEKKVNEFQKYLLNHQQIATLRISRGRDILAACGQLRSLWGTAKGTEKHRDYPN